MYRITTRLASSNIIEKKIGNTWTPWIAPLCSKEEGDKICTELYNHLTNPER